LDIPRKRAHPEIEGTKHSASSFAELCLPSEKKTIFRITQSENTVKPTKAFAISLSISTIVILLGKF